MKNNIKLINQTAIKSELVTKELDNALNFLPKGIKELINLYDVKFFYQELMIIDSRKVKDKTAAGLFLVNEETNKPEIYILVKDGITAADRVKTVIHELGHFVDYVMFNHYFKDNEFYYDYPYWSFGDDLFDYELDDMIRDVFKKELYPTWGEQYNYFNLSVIEQFAETFKLLFMNYISEEKYPEYMTAFNKLKKHIDSSITLAIQSKKKEMKKEKVLNLLSKISFYKKEEKELFN